MRFFIAKVASGDTVWLRKSWKISSNALKINFNAHPSFFSFLAFTLKLFAIVINSFA
jgi:hypothetical protein